MKKLFTILLLSAAMTAGAQTKITKPQPKLDTALHYKFAEPEIIIIDNLVGQLDVLAGNSDKISTAQYNSIHRAVIHVDSLIKTQYFYYHPVKKEVKPSNK